MDDVGVLLHRTADEATTYLRGLSDRPVGATAGPDALAALLPAALPDEPFRAGAVLDELLAVTADGIVATGSPRYHGFVIGAALPATIAADWMTTAWDQNAGLYAGGPAASVLEQVAGRWVLDALDLPRASSVAMVTGCQMAHVTCLAAARHRVLADRGWDVERDGLSGAPHMRVLTGELHHVTLPRALRLLGLGQAALEIVPFDEHHRMRPDVLEAMLADDDRPTIVCAQLGEINTGAMDPVDAIADVTELAGAWVHVDGAFGLWARASTTHRHLTDGAEQADSWATDAHKWLNVPYDCGIAICAHPQATAAPWPRTRTTSSRARTGAATPSTGPPSSPVGLAAPSSTPHFASSAVTGSKPSSTGAARDAQPYAKGLSTSTASRCSEGGLDQVLLRFGDDERTAAVIDRLQDSGVLDERHPLARTSRHAHLGRPRQTGPDDVDRTIAAITDALAATA